MIMKRDSIETVMGGDDLHPFGVEREFNMESFLERFWRKYAIAIFAIGFLVIWTSIACGVTALIVKNNTTIDVTERMEAKAEADLQAYKDQLEQEKQISMFLSGEASLNAAIADDARLLAKIGQGIMNTYKGADLEDARKVMLCAVCRVYSGGEFSGIDSIKSAVTAPNQWWGYSDGMSYTEEVYEVAVNIARIYETGDPMPCSTDMVYAAWNGYEVVLRNRWEDNSSARHY